MQAERPWRRLACLVMGCYMLPPFLPTPVGWGTTAQANSTCSLAPEGSYSPGGLIVSTPIQPCTTGTTNTGSGNTQPASCNRCEAGKPCFYRNHIYVTSRYYTVRCAFAIIVITLLLNYCAHRPPFFCCSSCE
jgi:hypothetical protein